MKLGIVAAICTFLCHPALAQSAAAPFGIELGVTSLETLDNVRDLEPDHLHSVTPPHPNRLFSSYVVTAPAGIVCSVTAVSFEPREAEPSDFAFVRTALIGRYGSPQLEEREYAFWTTDDLVITLDAAPDNNDDSQLVLRYSHPICLEERDATGL